MQVIFSVPAIPVAGRQLSFSIPAIPVAASQIFHVQTFLHWEYKKLILKKFSHYKYGEKESGGGMIFCQRIAQINKRAQVMQQYKYSCRWTKC